SYYLRVECFSIYVSPSGDLSELSPQAKDSVQRHLNFARNLHIETRVLHGHNAPSTLVEFAHRQKITQIFLARSRFQRFRLMAGKSIISQILRLAQDIQITVVAERRKSPRLHSA